MTRGLVLAAGSVAVVLLAVWLGQQHLTMSAGMVLATLVVAAAIAAVVGWLLRLLAEGDRLESLEHKWKDRLAALQTDLGHIASRATALTADARSKDDQIIERDRTIATLTMDASKIDALHGILRDKDRLINDLDERINGLTLALDDRTTAMGQREAELASGADRTAALEQELAGLKSQVGNMVPRAHVDSISAKHSDAQSATSEEVSRLKRQLAAREQSLKDAAGKIATLEARTAEVATLRSRLAEADVRAVEIAHRIEELEHEVSSRVPEADYHEAKTQIAALRSASSKLADVEIRLLTTSEHATELSQRVRELEDRLSEMVPREEYEALNANLRSLLGRQEIPEPDQSRFSE